MPTASNSVMLCGKWNDFVLTDFMSKKRKDFRIDKLAARRQKKQVKEREERYARAILAFIEGKKHLPPDSRYEEEGFRRHLREYCDSWIESHYDVRRWSLRTRLEDDFANLD